MKSLLLPPSNEAHKATHEDSKKRSATNLTAFGGSDQVCAGGGETASGCAGV